VDVVLAGEFLESWADGGRERHCKIGIVELAFELQGLHVRKAFEDIRPRVALLRRVNLRRIDRFAEGPEEIGDGRSNLNGLIMAIHPEGQKPAARFVNEAEMEERERVEVLQGPVFWQFLEERMFGREHSGEADYRIDGFVALYVDTGGGWDGDSREEEGDVRVPVLVMDD